ncbi:MAG: hypothetical protein ACD_79C01208G0002 [uncultured bacterium]|nr:MAG: hypothetical protein ACD_79C01208G0002 [uncultured bacterium]
METFDKVLIFLQEQKEFIYKSKIAKGLNINNDTLNLILIRLEVKLDEKGRIKL